MKMDRTEGVRTKEGGFNFLEFVSGSHDHIKTRLWINSKMVPKIKGDERWKFLEFPIQGKVIKTPKGSLVLVPSEGDYVFLVRVHSGYRGSAKIIEVSPVEAGGVFEEVASGFAYHSPRGNLGVTAWTLINSSSPLKVKAHRTGRRIDKEELEFTIFPDGKILDSEEEGLEEWLT